MKRSWKSVISALLSMVLLLGCLPLSAAAATNMTTWIDGTDSADANGVRTLDVSVQANNTFNAMGLALSFDNSAVELVDASGAAQSGYGDFVNCSTGGYAVQDVNWTTSEGRTTVEISVSNTRKPSIANKTLVYQIRYKVKDASKMVKGVFAIDISKNNPIYINMGTNEESFYKKTADDTIALASFTYPGSDKQSLGSFTVSADGNAASVDVPKVLGAGTTPTAATLELTAAALDSDGDAMQTFPADAVWSLVDNNDDSNVTIAANASDKSKATLTVKPGAKANASLKVQIKSGSVTKTKDIAITRDTEMGTVVKLYAGGEEIAGNADTIVIPPQSATAATKRTYSAKLFDQYGGEVTGQTVTWTFTTADADVTFNNGEVSVTKAADKSKTYALKAAFGAVEKTITINLTDLEVQNWPAVSTTAVYGTTNAKIVTGSLTSGTAKAGNTTVTGSFSVKDKDDTQGQGAKKVTVIFTADNKVADYANATVEKEFDVTISKKPVTVKADDKTRVYGAANPTLTFTVSNGALVGNDTNADLAVTLNCAATVSSPAGTPVDITGTSASANYDVTVTKGTLTITKATITGYTASGFPLTILANDPANTDAASLKAKMVLPATTTVTYADGTDSLPITWANATERFNIKGGTYTYKGTVTPGTNFNAYNTPLTATLTVTPVTGTINPALTTPVVIAKSVAEKASNYSAFKLPASVTVKFDNGVADATYNSLTWSVPLATLKTKAVNSKTDVKLTSLPEWITIADSALTVQVQITDKFPVTVTVTQADTTYGTALAAPVPAQTAIDDGTDASATFSYRYIGTTAAGKKYDSATPPTDAGTYTVTATLVSDTHAGSGTSASFTIAPKALTAGMVTAIPAEDYNTQAHEPVVEVKDGTALVKDTDYTVSYQDNVDAGTATVVITGKGNYTGTVNQTFTINKASIAAIQAEITPAATAKVGDVLTASLPGVADDEVTYTWLQGSTTLGTGRTYVVAATDSNKDITVKATAKGVNYAAGDSQTSDPVTVEKQTISGSVSISVKNDNDGDSTKIGATDVITVAVTGVQPAQAQAGLTYQWNRDGQPITGATSANYTVTNDDAGAKLSVTVSGGGDYAGELSAEIEVGKTVLTGTVSVAGASSPVAVGDELTASVTSGADPADYEIVWTRDGETIPGATGEKYTITSDDAGKTVAAKIVAKGASVTGEVVGTGVAVPAAAPDKPELTLSAASGSITASWKAPAANGAPILEYRLDLSTLKEGVPALVTSVTANSGDTSYKFDGLTNGTEYTVSIVAVNSEGPSAADTKTALPRNSGGGYVPVTEEPTDEPVTETSTAADGTVTETTTWADGKTAVAVTTPDGDKTITVKDGDGDTLAEVEIPAKPAAGKKFVDVPDTAWYAASVDDTAAYKLFSGTSDTTFSPEMPMTRGMLVTVLHNLSGNPEYGTDKHPFADVKNGAWYEDPADWASAVGVTSGTDKGFEPDLSINREQLVTMLFNYAKLIGADTKGHVALSGFPDANSVSTFAKNAMEWAVAEGLIYGRDNGSATVIAPKGNASRAEVAAIMSRFVKYLAG